MREITVTLVFAFDDAFDELNDAELVASIKEALLRGYPLLWASELEVRQGPIVDTAKSEPGPK